MKCPHCDTGVRIEFEELYQAEKDPDNDGKGLEVSQGNCPECTRLIVVLRRGEFKIESYSEYQSTTLDIESEEILFPRTMSRSVEAEVPKSYRTDYLEAVAVLPLSAKASAALSRRLLQKTLREQLGIKRKNLVNEIEAFMEMDNVPSFLSEAVDAIRNVGNFAAHPLKDTNTGEIVDVELGEAEWLLDVLDSLFDFVFVQPVRLQNRRDRLNEKLESLGKPPMKSS